MSLQLIFSLSKKIHRLTMWFMLVLGMAMATGGLILHRSVEGDSLPDFVDVLFVRYWHNQLAVPFVTVLAIMMLTGFFMWLVPKLLSRSRPQT